jgi:Holliday junction resolvase
MPNKNYVNGRRKEYKLVHALKEKGFIAFRSAGSHSPFDVVGVNMEKRVILFCQLKPESHSKKETKRLLEEYKLMHLTTYLTNFFVVTDVNKFIEENFPHEAKPR